MKAKLTVIFEEINGIKVDDSLLKNVPQLFQSTEKTVQILSEQIKKYFKDNKINVRVNFELKK